MRILGRIWLLIAVAFALATVIAARMRSHRAAPEYVDKGTEPAGLEPQPVHRLRSEETVDGERFVITNLVYGPIEADCGFLTAENVTATPPLPRKLLVPSRADAEVTLLTAGETDAASRAEVQCVAALGDPNAPARNDVAYAVPFPAGTEFVVAQGFNGAFSHRGQQSRYALDLGVPKGTPVRAARAGLVMQVEDDFHGRGVDLEKFGDRANYVRVLHDDGSMAVYAHLAPETAMVSPGERVSVGQYLARSGDTGFTTGPHLHFVVQKNAGMALVSIPFTMPGVDTGDH